MLSYTLTSETLVYVYAYMIIYNITLTTLFWVFFNIMVSEINTLYSLSNLYFNPFKLTTLTILLLSMAGVPPFMGFFSKLFIIMLILTRSFFLIYTLFFVILLLSLYFYIQNIRFLHNTNYSNIQLATDLNPRRLVSFYYFSISVIIFLAGGVFFIDDILLIVRWILI